MTRPADLPDFTDPPLGEVVLGVQFNPPKGYQQIFAGDVWALFRSRYPHVQEQPPLAPMFETFGPQMMSHQLRMFGHVPHNRFWFLTEAGDELIQFQQDRLLHNWRQVPGVGTPYPRFEAMADGFRDELSRLQQYMSTLVAQELHITQCEISYVNTIAGKDGKPIVVGDWLRPFSADSALQFDDFSGTFRQVILTESGQPVGRLFVEVASTIGLDMSRSLNVNFTVRGAPSAPTVAAAIDFLSFGRRTIVSRFAELTTDLAHNVWGRTR